MSHLLYYFNKPKGNNIITYDKFIDNAKFTDYKCTGKIACVFHTSGTTGFPKGVALSNRAINTMCIQYLVNYRGCRGDVFLNQVPPFLAYNFIMSTHVPLSYGMQIYLLPKYEPEKFARNIQKIKPNHVLAGPADWESFLHTHIYLKDFSFLKTLGSGSDYIKNNIKNQINGLLSARGCKSCIMEGYGMTEVGSAFSTNTPWHDVPKSVGIPLPMNNCCIYDNTNNCELKYNEIGEICMRSPTLMQCYLNDANETSKVLIKHNDGEIWLHSGDMGRIDENGNIYIEGRIRRIIITYCGTKITPYAVENLIRNIDGIIDCCVVGKPDYEHGRGFVPAVFIEKNNSAEETELKHIVGEIVRTYLEELNLSIHISFISKIPLTGNGKVDYRILEQAVKE